MSRHFICDKCGVGGCDGECVSATAERSVPKQWKNPEFVIGAGHPSGTPIGQTTETPKQRARRLGIPYVEPIRSTPYRPSLPNQPIAVCGGCGRNVYSVESYSCPRGNCPIQPKTIGLSC